MRDNLKESSRRAALRAVLSDVLPFELPVRFDTQGLYTRMTEDANPCLELCKLLNSQLRWSNPSTIPLRFRSSKSGLDMRELWVVHPLVLPQLVDIYAKYGGLILSLTSRSPWSIRRPTAVSRTSHQSRSSRKKSAVSRPEQPNNIERDHIELYCSSYFAYAPFTHLFRFRQSPAFHELEQRYRLMRKLDIANCFSSIYTHSISWAVKGKPFAKENLKPSVCFDRLFDDLMQSANHRETAGIPIGPEFSRVFAEVILQATDLAALRGLERDGLLGKVHVARWVDDYFLFANSEENLDRLEANIAEALLAYNLRLKREKSITLLRPFTSEREQRAASAVSLLRDPLKHLRALLVENEVGRSATSVDTGAASKSWSSVMDNVRNLLGPGTDDDRDSAIAALLRAIRREMRRTRRLVCAKEDGSVLLSAKAGYFLQELIRVVFYVTSLSMKMRDTFIANEIVIDIHTILGRAAPSTKGELMRRIRIETSRAINLALSSNEPRRSEAASLLHILTSLEKDGRMSVAELRSLGLRVDRDASYFELLEILQFFGERAVSEGIAEQVTQEAISRIRRLHKGWILDTSTFLLVVDLSVCPYLTLEQRLRICGEGLRAGGHSNPDKAKTVKALKMMEKGGNWLYRWGGEVDSRLLIRRKELRPAYS